MERDTSENQLGHVSDFILQNFIDDTNFEQFIDLIRGETSDPIVKFCPNYDCEHISGCLDDNQWEKVQGDVFGFHSAAISTPNSAINTLQLAVGDEDVKDGEEEDEMEEESSGTTTTTTTPTRRKGDRSRTLVSERRRRGRMKEKLYALRALVPNITKMDKASIVGDAVLYVQDLQMQAKKLKSEIAGLESSLVGGGRNQQGTVENRKNTQFTPTHLPIFKTIMQMDIFQVEERGFYVRVECNRGQGVAASLYKALESLARLNVQSSNLGTLSERFILTFTLQVRDREPDMNLPNLKLWVTGALLNQGFVFQTLPSA
ncbi:transcription factor FER-LIKE IRON DEFICIENCY-INDUCED TRANSCRIPTION FACTOR [Actinidia eriantha]|uniref:transcription factor FER-LIKE IRON DEFICIENCY-INDUCED TRANSCRIPTION FACTOR n=1 Tax=Actinidia eriantha TaxID=165200 RepID=UPI0025846106|nr:transcription factor FER-LIKE IRON DEFICIENCY-INDUCED TRANSCRIPTION FACTOR [Actinidia eriantha]